jgi:hypothetical protein
MSYGVQDCKFVVNSKNNRSSDRSFEIVNAVI